MEQYSDELKKYIHQRDNNLSRIDRAIREIRNTQQYYYHRGLSQTQYEYALKEWYFQKTGKHLNLENPQTYNEKIQWMKLYDSTQQKADLADKFKVRDYVKEKLGEEYLIPLLGVWDTPEEIPFESLPNQFVLKTNHGSGYNIIVPDKSKISINGAKNNLLKWLCTDFAFVSGLEI